MLPDDLVVPTKPPNKAVAAEVVEGRRSAKGNTDSAARPGRSAGQSVSPGLDRVLEAARKDKKARFTALLHHLDVDRLRVAYRALNPAAAPGVDGVTWAAYGADLEVNLQDLLTRLRRGSYRAQPSRRAYIPKADGRQRPLGIASLEDKLVQRAVVDGLNAIYETDFLGFSYGCRPGRSPHHALDALATGILRTHRGAGAGWLPSRCGRRCASTHAEDRHLDELVEDQAVSDPGAVAAQAVTVVPLRQEDRELVPDGLNEA